MFYVTDMQAVEPDTLEAQHGVRWEITEEADSMGFPRVTVSADKREDLIAYIADQWGADEDPAWFQEYVLDRVEMR
jgi:hypothetical protein